MSVSVVDAFCCGSPVLRALLHMRLCLPFVLELTRLGMKMEGMIAREGDLQRRVRVAGERGRGGDACVQWRGDDVPRDGSAAYSRPTTRAWATRTRVLMSSPRRDTLVLAQ